MKNGTKYYEFSYSLPGTLTHDEALAKETELRGILGALEVTLDSWDSPKRQMLAYPIREERESYIGALRFTTTPDVSVRLQEELREQPSLKRFMVLEWKKAVPMRRKPAHQQTSAEASLAPVDEAVIDEKLDEILGIENEPQ